MRVNRTTRGKVKLSRFSLLFLLLMLLALSCGCVESYTDVRGEVRSTYVDGDHRFLEVKVMKFFGDYRDDYDWGYRLESGEVITIYYDPEERDFPSLEKGDYVEMNIVRGFSEDNESNPFEATHLRKIRHPYLGAYFFLIGLMVSLGVVLYIFVVYHDLDPRDRITLLTSEYGSTVSCPFCEEDVDLSIHVPRFFIPIVRIWARCEECDYEFELVKRKRRDTSLWGISQDQRLFYTILSVLPFITIIPILTIIIGGWLSGYFDSHGIPVSGSGLVVCYSTGFLISLILTLYIYSRSQGNLALYPNENGIRREIKRHIPNARIIKER